MKTVIIDGNALLHRCMRVGTVATLTNRYGKSTGGFFASLRVIHGVLVDHKIDEAYVVFDSGISERRRELLPEYKGPRYRNREDPFYEEPDTERALYLGKFRVQRAMLEYILPRLGVRVVRLKEPHGWEADDLIYVLTQLLASCNILVVSDDKDMLQLVSNANNRHVELYRPVAKQYISQDTFLDVVGYDQNETLLRKAILGDPSDNIPKVRGCGDKGVNTMFMEGAPVSSYPFDDFFVWCIDHHLKKVRSISDNMDIVLRNYELMDLTLEDMSASIEPLNAITRRPVEVDLITVKRFFTELDLHSLVRELHAWAIAFQRLR